MTELYEWLEERGVDPGTAFFRLHVVDMAGRMDVEVGVTTPTALDGDDRVRCPPGGTRASPTSTTPAGPTAPWSSGSGTPASPRTARTLPRVTPSPAVTRRT
jgi:hypothetical protein